MLAAQQSHHHNLITAIIMSMACYVFAAAVFGAVERGNFIFAK